MVKKDKVQVTLEVDGKQGINELGKLEMEAKDLRASLKGLKKDTEEYNQANAKLKVATAEMAKLREQMGLTGMTMRQLTSYQRDLQTQWNGLTKGTAQWKEVDTQLKAVNSTIAQQRAELKGTAGVWGFLKSEIGKFGALALSALGLQAIIGKIDNLIARSAKLSDAMSDLRMTTGLSADAAEAYNKALGSLNTRTSREDLLGIGKIAGQFGVAKDELLDFTAAMNKTTVVLSSEFSGGAEEITSKMATLRNVFTDIKSDNISEDITHISNAVVVLAQEGVATAPVVTDFANRIGGVGINLGLTTPQVLGLSASMQELGITAERGGTAVGKILQKMTTNTDEFAKVAGMGLKEFSDLVNKDIYSAFLKVLEGSKKGGEGAIVLGRLIKDLEISGAGASEVFSKLGNNMDLLANRTGLAGNAIKSTSAITEQYNQKNENFAANMERVQKAIAAFFISSSTMTTLASFVDFLAKLSDVKVSEKLTEERAELNYLVTAITTVNDEYGTRKRLLDELKQSNPEFVEGLDLEKVTNVELLAKLKEVNKEYERKIFLQVNQERITELIKQEQDAVRGLAKAEKDLAEAKAKSSTVVQRGGVTVDREALVEERKAALKQRLADIKQARQDFEREAEEAAQMMFGDEAVVADPGGAGRATKGKGQAGNTQASGETEAEKKAREKREAANAKALEETKKHLAEVDRLLEENGIQRELSQQEKADKELQLIDNKYQAEILKVGGYEQEMLNNDSLTKQQKLDNSKLFEEQISSLEAQWKQARADKELELEEQTRLKKAEVEEKIRLALQSKDEAEVERIKTFYEKLIDEAERYGIASISIYEAMYAAIQAQRAKDSKDADKETKKRIKTEEEKEEAIRTMAADTANVLGQMMEVAGMNQRDSAIFQQIVASSLILTEQAVAIAKAISNNTAGDPYTMVPRIIAAVGAITSLFVTIKRNQPAPPSAPVMREVSSTPKRRNYYFGGETGTASMGWSDANGPIVGGVHANEYVVPSFIRHRPAVINATRVVEAERRMALRGGYTQPGKPTFFEGGETGGESTDMTAVVAGIQQGNLMLAAIAEGLLSGSIKAYVVDQQVGDSLDRMLEARRMGSVGNLKIGESVSYTINGPTKVPVYLTENLFTQRK